MGQHHMPCRQSRHLGRRSRAMAPQKQDHERGTRRDCPRHRRAHESWWSVRRAICRPLASLFFARRQCADRATLRDPLCSTLSLRPQCPQRRSPISNAPPLRTEPGTISPVMLAFPLMAVGCSHSPSKRYNPRGDRESAPPISSVSGAHHASSVCAQLRREPAIRFGQIHGAPA